MSTCPAIKSTPPGRAPLDGTCVNRAPVSAWNNSPTRWLELPVPREAMDNRPGFVLPRPITSLAVLAGPGGCTTSTNGVVAPRLTGPNSRTGWYASFGYRLGATLPVVFDPTISV